MSLDSAAGPDGFNGYFYNFCWEIIKDDLFAAVSEFFAMGELPKAWTCANLLPVPKVENPSSHESPTPKNENIVSYEPTTPKNENESSHESATPRNEHKPVIPALVISNTQ